METKIEAPCWLVKIFAFFQVLFVEVLQALRGKVDVQEAKDLESFGLFQRRRP